MKMDVEVISREIIKPTTTSPHKNYKFTVVDQISPPLDMPVIYFFSLDHHCKLTRNEISTHLKTSLSQVLNHYYPLVGTVQQNSIDCNNGGVLVFEAQVNCNLSDILLNPNPDKFVTKFLPENVNNLVLTVQINFFNCGGIAIGVCIYHKVADGLSLFTFVGNWAKTARGDLGNNIHAKIVDAAVFPPKKGVDGSPIKFHVEKNIMLKRFVFTNSGIMALKEKYVATLSPESNSSKTYPSRYKTLSSFLWSRFVASTETENGSKRIFSLSSAVNMRKIMDPPLPDDSFGNMSGAGISIFSSEEVLVWNYDLINKMTRSISKINRDFVKKLQDGKLDTPLVYEGRDENTFKGDQRPISLACSSLCRFPVYEADFGWGRPAWFAFGGLPRKNVILFVDTKNGDGIEAWVYMTDEDMSKFETDKELLTYASSTSCPL